MAVPLSLVLTGRLLEGRTIVLCGAAREKGMGLTTAKLFAEHGANVAILDVDKEEVQQAAASIPGGNATGIQIDIRDSKSCRDAISQVLQWEQSNGRIDALVNFSGITQKRTVMEITEDDYELVAAINLKGVVNLSQAVIPAMRAQKNGSILHISSMSAQQGGGIYGGAHYCATKAGVLGFVRALAKELGADNIRANAITPGLTLTDFSRSGRSDEEKHASAKGWPMARAASTQEMAGACLFLVSDLSTYVTGTTLDVNGGAYMH